ncbi:MAG TPA: response regulator transcription factor [Trueperaceae bacterium]|nr:response regulator transcription factor [Trueperaceae bacterium]
MAETRQVAGSGRRAPRLLVLEDDHQLASLLSEQLSLAGYTVSLANTLAAARELVGGTQFDLLILDRNLPDGDGLSIAEEVAAEAANGAIVEPAVLMLTAIDDVESRVNALYAGASDYLTKPFSMQELLARVHARLRERGSGERLAYGDLTLDASNNSITRGDLVELLPETEFTVLAMLLKYRGRVLTQVDLERSIYGAEVPDSNTVEVYVYNVRRKLKRMGLAEVVRTVRGKGYIVI